ncbi:MULTISPECIES: bifunctional acetate--CoA ligase family protein/GNAT family N-acetyltransferase [unclassified Mesorhizobium]|uniref:bifunctional acetate--CoA ligase family protein/GNAT family N-acetyltransferase n=1 Tax=unclassified Mesorhizobium TaxID=325217 RepID=UPI00112E91EF|nr:MULTISPECIES: bifunctional acetate--CoA ligase family protein/GNAT family N-acetyltransferase [unclassified Mesorhizobium]TPJ39673.1 bifunctional acetate--CoA ligase family protein/GNAT family N-acetyltransferase [Mesorhizobium sp. B2-6-6]MCA0008749.1 bifunctional acetate--CoA ligase family protein/GNAT family N-acetyltransferase [Mesorhizobium sp. B264B1B]MCA0022426.1 bifunctional acetate--CoA ligase family protein/GNAT family N-acetyltransferase [Mesorhizobium sp. B264B1A]MCA0024586.1 bifu
MTIRNLEHAFAPRSVAVFGASVREGSVGRVVFDNMVSGGFEGEIWPVNPKYSQVAGRQSYAKAADLPGVPDLGVIVTPPRTVPAIVRDLAEKGTRAAIVITAGLTHENGLRQAMLDAAKPTVFRIIGPNTVGLMIPPLKLNAGFAHMAAKPGSIALLSQSGAIATSLIDWAADNNVGFAQIVSLGDMADVDVGDCLDMLAGDMHTRAIVMYLETIPNPRKFISAARAAARIKPVIAIKSGRHEQSAKAAATHTGALSGADRVVDAALLRAGILRVKGLTELFDAVETTARFVPLERARVGIVTNGGGAGVLAVDQLVEGNGHLAELSPETITRLDAVLPSTWSHANPVDIIGDAPPERYAAAIEAIMADAGTDVVLVMNCPTGLGSPLAAASAVAVLAQGGKISGKPVLTCWLGEHTAREGRRVLQDAGLASFETPADAATAVSYLSEWSRAQRALMRTPSSRSDIASDREAALAIFRAVAREGRRMLTESEAKAAISAYGIPVPETIVARSPAEAQLAASRFLKTSEQAVVKLLSKAITHKSDIGGVVLGIADPVAAGEAARAIEARVRKHAPQADIEGYAVQPMVARKQAQELILGISRDPIFGPVILFGAGGVAVEVMNDTAIALPPLDDILAGDLIDQTRIGRVLAGFRDRKPADRQSIIASLNGLSQMIVDFPCLVAVDINPLLADAEGVIALDARIEIEPERVEEAGPNPALAIRPYPSGWEKVFSAGDIDYNIRPIKPADISLYPEFLARISPDDLRLRFLSPRKSFSDQMLKRLTQLDYGRNMAFVALNTSSGALAGISRISCDPDHTVAEYALLVRTDLQGNGLGWELLSQIVDYARADGIGRIEGIMLAENTRMLAMCREFGFSIRRHPSEPGLVEVTLELS